MRSLKNNDPEIIERRKTFASTGEQQASILLEDGTVNFQSGSWSSQKEDIHIFDQQYIAENVHGGSQVEIEHRRNFYRIVVGSKGVALAENLDKIEAEIATTQKNMSNARRLIEQHVEKSITFDSFINKKELPDIDANIDLKIKSILAIQNSEAIAGRELLIPPTLPFLPRNFLDLLAKGVDGLGKDAEERVRQQVSRHDFHSGGETWLSHGLIHITDDLCPFCASSLNGNELVRAYRHFFSSAYIEHKEAIVEMSKSLDSHLSAAVALRVEQAFRKIAADAEFWLTYCQHGYEPPEATEQICSEIEALLVSAKAMLTAKEMSPLDPVLPSDAFLKAQAAWLKTQTHLRDNLSIVPSINEKIQNVKRENAGADSTKLKNDLNILLHIKKRHTEPVSSLVSDYIELSIKKESLETDKLNKKNELNSYDEAILKDYEKDINLFLESFGSSFRLEQCRKNYAGKLPQSQYFLRFDTSDVDVTKSRSSGPGFDTSMSTGDKNTFALAFFLTQIKRDPDIKRKVVVFDDPFTSLDDFRRAMTAREIIRTRESIQASQVIVFSHDKFFLDAVRKEVTGGSFTALQISSNMKASSIESWDIEAEVKDGYLQDFIKLKEFSEGGQGDVRAMLTIMRPLLEKYIRFRFPCRVLGHEWLGDMLKTIRSDSEHPLQPQYNEIDDINSYTSRFHHDPNEYYEDEEVRTYAKRTIAVVGSS